MSKPSTCSARIFAKQKFTCSARIFAKQKFTCSARIPTPLEFIGVVKSLQFKNYSVLDDYNPSPYSQLESPMPLWGESITLRLWESNDRFTHYRSITLRDDDIIDLYNKYGTKVERLKTSEDGFIAQLASLVVHLVLDKRGVNGALNHLSNKDIISYIANYGIVHDISYDNGFYDALLSPIHHQNIRQYDKFGDYTLMPPYYTPKDKRDKSKYNRPICAFELLSDSNLRFELLSDSNLRFELLSDSNLRFELTTYDIKRSDQFRIYPDFESSLAYYSTSTLTNPKSSLPSESNHRLDLPSDSFRRNKLLVIDISNYEIENNPPKKGPKIDD